MTMEQRIQAAPGSVLYALEQRAWREWGAGRLSDLTATMIIDAIGSRRHELRQRKARVAQERPRSEKTMLRRKMAAAGPCPPQMASHYTLGEQAILMVIAFEIRKHGFCDLAVGEIARLAGGSETAVRNTRRKAVQLGHMNVQVREHKDLPHETNILTAKSKEWITWIKKSAVSEGRAQKRDGDNQESYISKGKTGDSASAYNRREHGEMGNGEERSETDGQAGAEGSASGKGRGSGMGQRHQRISLATALIGVQELVAENGGSAVDAWRRISASRGRSPR